ncbi:MAG: hypothetical protein ACR2KP_02045 [Egibacteraceae bacterium]
MNDRRTSRDSDVSRRVVAQWVAAGPALAEFRRQELADLTAHDALRATIALHEALAACRGSRRGPTLVWSSSSACS